MSGTSAIGVQNVRDLCDFPQYNTLSADDRRYVFAVAAFFSTSLIMVLVRLIVPGVSVPAQEWTAGAVVLIPLALFLLDQVKLRRRGILRIMPFCMLYGLLIFLLWGTLSAHPDFADAIFDRELIATAPATLLSPIAPVFAVLLVSLAPSPQRFVQGLMYAAWLNYGGNFLRLLQFFVRGHWDVTSSEHVEAVGVTYNMDFGYGMLFSVAVFLFLAISGRRQKLYGLAAAVGTLLILLWGSRGALVGSLAALVVYSLYWVLTSGSSRSKRLITVALAFIAPLAVIAALGPDGVAAVAEAAGLQSRSVEKLSEGVFNTDPARAAVRVYSQELIAEGGPFGWGIYADRHLISQRYWFPYPHNILLELQITFGRVPGTLILVGLVGVVAVALFRWRGSGFAAVIVLLLPLIVQLHVSSSYLASKWLWAILGASYRAILDKRSRHEIAHMNDENVSHTKSPTEEL